MMKRIILFFILIISICTAVSCEKDNVDSHVHKYNKKVTPSTCTVEGYIEYVCDCGENYRDATLPLISHDFKGIAYDSKNSIATFKCNICGLNFKEKHTHDYSFENYAPTCTDAGYVIYTCRCSDTYKVTTEPASHSFGSWVFTGSTNELKVHTCTVCGISESEIHFHTYVIKASKDSTCRERGYIITVCECGFEQKTDLDLLAHSYGAWITTLEPTEDSEGEKYRACQECGEKENFKIPQLSHTHSYTEETFSPTCTAEGYTKFTCSCGDTYNTDIVVKTAHPYLSWTVSHKATETSNGIKKRVCSACGHIESAEYSLTFPSFTPPADLTSTVGSLCSEVVLPAGFSYDGEPGLTFTEAGIAYIKASYTDPTDPENYYYCTAHGINIAVTVSPLKINYTPDFSYLENYGYTGEALTLPTVPEEYAECGISFGFRKNGKFINYLPTEIGTYSVYAYCTNKNYTTDECEFSFDIVKNTDYLQKLVLNNVYYTNEPYDITLPFAFSAHIEYKKGEAKLSTPPSEVGAYSAIITINGSENVAPQRREFTFSILKDETAPVWDIGYEWVIDPDTNTVTLLAHDNAKIDHYILMKSIGGEFYYSKLYSNTFVYDDSASYYWCNAVDVSGNISEDCNVSFTKYQLPPENIYPADASIVNTSYLEFQFDGMHFIELSESPDMTDSVTVYHPYLPSLKNNTTYYWSAKYVGGNSPVYSFTVSYPEEELEALFPENNAYIYEKHLNFVVNSNDLVKIYFARAASDVWIEWDSTYKFQYMVAYKWYAEDSEGNKTDIKNFVYAYNGSAYPEGLYIEGEPVMYTNRDSIVMYGISEFESRFMSYMILPKGTDAGSQYSTYLIPETGYRHGKRTTGMVRNLLDGDCVYISITDNFHQRSKHVKYIVDMAKPQNCSPIAEYDEADGWRITITPAIDDNLHQSYYRLDMGQWTPLTEEITLYPEHDEYFLELRSVDLAKNESYDSYYAELEEYTSPEITLAGASADKVTNEDVTVSVSQLPNNSVYYYINGEKYSPNENPSITLTEEGEHYIWATFKDANAKEHISKPIRILIDKTAPVIGKIYAPDPDIYYNVNAKYTYILVDLNEIEEENGYEIYYKMEGVNSDWRDYSEYDRVPLYSYYLSKSGIYRVAIRVVDEAGNIAEKNVSLAFDVEGPTIGNFELKKELDPETGKFRIFAVFSDITDDHTYLYHIHFQVWSHKEYYEGLESIVDISEYTEPGTTEFIYEFTDMPAGDEYYFLLYIVDEHINPVYSNLYYFYMPNLETKFVDGDFVFTVVDGEYILYDYTGSDETVTLPETANGHNYKIAYRAFEYTESMKTVIIPDSVIKIETYAFIGCTSLENVIMNDIGREIEVDAFLNCTGLTTSLEGD